MHESGATPLVRTNQEKRISPPSFGHFVLSFAEFWHIILISPFYSYLPYSPLPSMLVSEIMPIRLNLSVASLRKWINTRWELPTRDGRRMVRGDWAFGKQQPRSSCRVLERKRQSRCMGIVREAIVHWHDFDCTLGRLFSPPQVERRIRMLTLTRILPERLPLYTMEPLTMPMNCARNFKTKDTFLPVRRIQKSLPSWLEMSMPVAPITTFAEPWKMPWPFAKELGYVPCWLTRQTSCFLVYLCVNRYVFLVV